jgi:CRISPR-associated protein Cmr1
MALEKNTIQIKTLTPLWTGDVKGECNEVKETGIIGSLRWWYEALVRGLGGYACDVTSENPKERCDYGRDKGNICDACKFFGCTGWSRRFRLEVLDIDEKDIKKGSALDAGVKQNAIFGIRIIPLYELNLVEKWLFKKTLFLIEKYGAIGGRTTRKPQDSKVGMDYGLIEILDYAITEKWDNLIEKREVETFLRHNRNIIGKENKKEVFDFNNYWIVEDRYLDRRQINRVVNRNQDGYYADSASSFDRWLGGERAEGKRIGKSKKIFSFKEEKRVFGYVRDEGEIKKIEKRIEEILGKNIKFKTGKEILGGIT